MMIADLFSEQQRAHGAQDGGGAARGRRGGRRGVRQRVRQPLAQRALRLRLAH